MRVTVLVTPTSASLVRPLIETWQHVLDVQTEVRELTKILYGTGKRWPPPVLNTWLPGYPDPEYYLRLFCTQTPRRMREGSPTSPSTNWSSAPVAIESAGSAWSSSMRPTAWPSQIGSRSFLFLRTQPRLCPAFARFVLSESESAARIIKAAATKPQ